MLDGFELKTIRLGTNLVGLLGLREGLDLWRIGNDLPDGPYPVAAYADHGTKTINLVY